MEIGVEVSLNRSVLHRLDKSSEDSLPVIVSGRGRTCILDVFNESERVCGQFKTNSSGLLKKV